MDKYKRLIIILLSFISFCLIIGIIITFTYEKAVIHYLKKYLDKHLTTEIEVSKINFSVFKKFPNASVELKQIMAKSSLGFSDRDFGLTDTDTLLFARSIFFEFSLPGIIRGDYKIKNISVINGEINLFIDRNGRVNYSIWENDKTSSKSDIEIKLQNILLSNVSIRYLDLSNDIDIVTRSKKVNLIVDVGELNHIKISGSTVIKKLGIKRMINYIEKNIFLNIDFTFRKNEVRFKKSYIQSGKSQFDFSGEVLKSERTKVNLTFDSKEAFLNDLADFFPEKFEKFNTHYTLSGSAIIYGTITGFIYKGSQPLVNITFKINNGSISNRNNKRKFSDITLNGNYTAKSSGAIMKINDFSSKLGNSSFNGVFTMVGFEKPKVDLTLKSEINFNEFTEFLNLDTLENTSGTINTNIILSGQLPSSTNLTIRDFFTLKQEGTISVKDLFFNLKGTQFNFEKMNGLINLGAVLKLRNYTFNISGNDFSLNCNLSNFQEFIFNKGNLYAEAEIHSSYLDMKELIKKEQEDDSIEFISFPENLFLKANFTVNKFVYGKFSATEIAGAVTYEPKTFHFHSFQLNSVDGFISGSVAVAQDFQKVSKIDCSASLSKINIQKLFYSFNNFTQDFILDKNMKGKISGQVNFNAAWDHKMNLIPNTIEANADIEIQNGQIIDFEPMMGLSRFVAVDELKNLKFSTLKNQIIIKDQTVFIPEMEIHSNAFDIRGSGVHKFDNSYDYRILVQLSALLAKKAIKKKAEINEFGVEEEDGLGRMNIPIKIIGKGDDFDVTIDRKKAFSLFKKNVADEKDELKSLIKKENNTNIQQETPDNQNNKFIIDWDEGNDKKDFIFEKNEPAQNKPPRFDIEWDEDENTDKIDSADY